MVCLPTEPDALQHYNATHQIRVKRQVTIVLVSQAGGGASAFPGLLPQMRDGVEQQRDRHNSPRARALLSEWGVLGRLHRAGGGVEG